MGEIKDDFGANDWLIEDMREAWAADPEGVSPEWQAYFAGEGTPSAQPEKPQPVQTTPAAPAAMATAPTAPSAPAPKPAAPVAQPAAPAPKPAAPAPAPAEQKPAATKPAATQQPAATTGSQKPGSAPAAKPAAAVKPAAPTPATETTKVEPTRTILKGAPMRTARNMEASLQVPTATSVRTIPMKLLIEIRSEINDHLKRTRGGKVSFTHIIAYAQVQAIKTIPAMNNAFEDADGKAVLIQNPAINLGIAIDVKKKDGTRNLVVPCIKNAQDMDFAQFHAAYEELVKKGRENTLGVDDFAGTSASITNPGGIGTVHSVPRLMGGQGHILGVGSIDYPVEYMGVSQDRLDEMGISKVTTFTSTYDHRVIQGAQSGEFLKVLHELITGQHDFYDGIYHDLRIPFAPLRWARDNSFAHEYDVDKQSRVLALIEAYRSYGHLVADTDPLVYAQRTDEDLELSAHGLSIWDLDRTFATGTLSGSEKPFLKLRDILTVLRDAYCRHIGVEYMYINEAAQRRWFQEQVERPFTPLSHEVQLRVLDRLNEAEIFETFLQTKFVGQKRFSLEGAESTIVTLDRICEKAAEAGLDEVAIGMPHRGRLNVLTNIVGKSYGYVFREFTETVTAEGTGDVKYHLGAVGQFPALCSKPLQVSVAANPSHLEAVNPVLQGIARAKQDRSGRDDFPVLPVLLHGDASFAGQGINFETLQMSQLQAYRTGGTIHLVVNNQVGFTTAPINARSSVYCTDVAKAIQAPVFHVNGDDPEACARVARLAFDYRQKFHRDVVIDLVAYRLRGHNEGDDPSFTQPLMYDLIGAKHSVLRQYAEALVGRGDITAEEAEEFSTKFRTRLEDLFTESKAGSVDDEDYTRAPYYPAKPTESGGTAISAETMTRIADAQITFPEGFEVHKKVLPQLERRARAIKGDGGIDWSAAESLALGSLALEGRPIRLSGQDSRRGTFSQRFAGVVDRASGEAYLPLAHISEDQATFEVYDSFLSEYAAMGFEYGYSVAAPEALVLWEGQFGDFADGAQTIADEFISSGKAKWNQNSGVVLLLPHGFEGQGPDHSSARLERWLQLCAEDALAVCQPSTPASYFHLLRTHAYVNWHRPLVIATPKSMLRNKLAVSTPTDFTEGSWRHALADPSITDVSAVRQVILCSGKVRWDLVAERERRHLEGEVAIISLERLYPLPVQHLVEAMAPYAHVSDVRWVQDEPENQGAWPFLALHLPQEFAAEAGRALEWSLVSRPASSSPAVGSHHVHDLQAKDLMDRAFRDR